MHPGEKKSEGYQCFLAVHEDVQTFTMSVPSWFTGFIPVLYDRTSHRVSKEVAGKQLSKFQRLACISVTGAMKRTTTSAMEICGVRNETISFGV